MGVKDPVLAQSPNGQVGYVPAVCVSEQSSSKTLGAHYKVKYYDESESMLAPNEVICIPASLLDNILNKITEKESVYDSSTLSRASSNSSISTIGSKWNNISEK